MNKKFPVILTALVFLLCAVGSAGAQGPLPQTLLPGALIPKFIDPLPVAGGITVVDATAGGSYSINLSEFQAQILPAPNLNAVPPFAGYPASWVWGYLTTGDSTANARPSYLGPVVLAKRGFETTPTYTNLLPNGLTSNVQPYLPIDQTLDWADPLGLGCVGADIGLRPACASIYLGPQPAVPHIHGGEVAPAYDGGPDAWWTTDSTVHGAGFAGTTFIYPTLQQAGTIWFHDHALGITRLNVYAGMAGLYIITDPNNEPPQAGTTACTTPLPAAFGGCLPNAAYDIPLIIQDKSFDTFGRIYYNLASNPQPNSSVHPYWIPEFIGDTILVNGKTWPYLAVEPRKYRFRLVNGSNARFYDLTLEKNLSFTVIATDDGYLNAPVKTKNLIIAPGERYEVIVDFSTVANANIIMMNSARTPFPGGAKVVAGTTDRVMQFRVNLPLNTAIADATPLPTWLRDQATNKIVDIKTQAVANRPAPVAGVCTKPLPANKTIVRQLTLNEVLGPGGPLELVLNNTKYNGSASINTEFGRRDSEQPAVGDTEIWEIINITADAHPIHTHLASFQLLNRQAFNAAAWMTVYATALATAYPPPTNPTPDGLGPPNVYLSQNTDCAIGGNPAIGPYLKGRPKLPLPYENGWKDTAIMYPGEVTRIVVRWAETDAPLTTAAGANTYPFNPTALINGVGYVWHCHIIDHEDNEMMRPYIVRSARQPIN